MDAFKYFINKIDTNQAGRCYLGTEKKEELEQTWPASFHGILRKCVSTMAALSQKQVKVNNMNILDTI